ncbi:DUF5330 domain-containing protein [Mangrovibrevibacter kandeliae]|uniref:DUF5330 domain-containing protein n=1 Tax=Mangrovibrevibacter kandeliae TaxID=2968473 RepID=UPI002117BC59|nr:MULTISPECIES: DUF5330 domain-containing protein [unclassified Aurantimonas]MCQ8781063.1 DUF5330 domain-containing protein [Aurantimonas sp. CSK15Z-1]MCW4113844.1 DUF5330 domain-containing protein [Aurantimonas sp. MSK8Z-1]
MRFILKSAFWLGLIAFMLPGTGSDGKSTMSFATALVGAEEALQDLGGFCDRSPQACTAGREFAGFAGERIGDGLAIAYQVVGDRMATPGAAPVDLMATGAVQPVIDVATDPSASVAAMSAAPARALPRAYTPPQPDATLVADRPSMRLPVEASSRVPVPTPAPRA